jgi:two-component system LytT family response regulator
MNRLRWSVRWQYIERVPFLELVGEFENSMDALVYLKNNSVDLLFLDINMGAISGIQLLESADITCAVILTTAYHEYAIKGFDLNVSDYLLKPYTFERFLQAVNKVHANLQKNADPKRGFIFIKTENRLEKIILDDIFIYRGHARLPPHPFRIKKNNDTENVF